MLPLLTYLALTIPGNDGAPQKVETPSEVPTGGLEKGGTGQEIINNSIALLLISITVLSLFFLIFGGIKWIGSQGDKAKVDSARRMIFYAIAGLVLAFLSFLIVNTVGAVFGIQLLGGSNLPSDCTGGGPC